MEAVMAITVGVLFGAGLYMMMRRSVVKLILGLALISYAANLLMFTIGRLKSEQGPPFIPEGQEVLTGNFADPVPQALILTAIVIGFGMQAFALVLIKRVYMAMDTDDLDQMTASDQ
jgi:multicomponent Na+:H+ antiporter subunit C